MAAIAAGIAATVLLWWMVFRFAPVPEGAAGVGERLLFALRCFILAVLFCLVIGIEAVAHERLQSEAFDPLAGHVSRRLSVNLRYLQNSLEQILVFGTGLFGLAALESGAEIRRILLATTAAWIASRFAFWIGYHRSAAMRGFGMSGMAIGMAILLYLAWRIGLEAAGRPGGLAILAAFLSIELVLFRAMRSKGRA